MSLGFTSITTATSSTTRSCCRVPREIAAEVSTTMSCMLSISFHCNQLILFFPNTHYLPYLQDALHGIHGLVVRSTARVNAGK